MSKKVKVILVPNDNQIQILLNTMNKYYELCDYISEIVFERNCSRPHNLFYWAIDDKYLNLYRQVRHKFPDINTNMITMAFKKVPKAYTKKQPIEPLKFNGPVDYSSFMITIKHIFPPPDNIGMLTISTLSKRQAMHFVFDDTEREKLYISVDLKRYCEYKLSYFEEKFYLVRNLSKSKINEYRKQKNHRESA